MLEPWRSRYLGAMGIPQFVARDAALPGAAPSRPAAWDVARIALRPASSAHPVSSAVAVVELVEESSVAPLVMPSSRLPTIESTARSPRNGAVGTTSQHLPSGSRANQAVGGAPLGLMLADVGHDLLLVDHVSPAMFRSTTYRQLLGNVMHCIGRNVEAVELFEWPRVDLLPHLPRDKDSAKEAVTGCLLRLLGDATERRLLLLGRSSEWIDTGALAAMGCATTATVVDTSLVDCLTTPGAKRSLWLGLLPLCRR